MDIQITDAEVENAVNELEQIIAEFCQRVNEPKFMRLINLRNKLLRNEQFATEYAYKVLLENIRPCDVCGRSNNFRVYHRQNKIKNGVRFKCCNNYISPAAGTPLAASKNTIIKWFRFLDSIIQPNNLNRVSASSSTLKKMHALLVDHGLTEMKIEQLSLDKGLVNNEMLRAVNKINNLSDAATFLRSVNAMLTRK